MQEIWKDVKGYEGLYQVSNLGNVKSLDHIRRNGTNKYMQKGKILKPQKANGYCYVRLSKKGKTKQYLVHKLVANAFIKRNYKYKEINHINEIKSDNRADNLEWCTHLYNINYGTRNQRVSISAKETKSLLKRKKEEI